MTMLRSRFLLPLWLWLGTSCGPDFTEPQEIDRLRILGIRTELVEDPEIAWAGVDEDLRLSALATAETLPADIQLDWRFCPLAFGSAGDFECALDEESFQDLLLAVVEGALAQNGVPPELQDLPLDQLVDDLDFDLGSGPSVVFNLTELLLGDTADALDMALDELVADGTLTSTQADGLRPGTLVASGLEQFCETIQTQEFPEFVERPECNGTFEFRVDVQASTDTDDLRAVRFFTVIYDEESVFATPNRNPKASLLCGANRAIRAENPDAPTLESLVPDLIETNCTIPGDPGITRLGLDEPPSTAFFGSPLDLIVPDLCVDPTDPSRPDPSCETNAEAFIGVDTDGEEIDEREILTLSWFVDAGSVNDSRTAFEVDNDDSPLSEARRVRWDPPRAIDFEDPMNEVLQVYVVIRDNRGGRAFLQGAFTIVERPEPAAEP
jgi:hypothetical protein